MSVSTHACMYPRERIMNEYELIINYYDNLGQSKVMNNKDILINAYIRMP
jgi:hypothetical protein